MVAIRAKVNAAAEPGDVSARLVGFYNSETSGGHAK